MEKKIEIASGAALAIVGAVTLTAGAHATSTPASISNSLGTYSTAVEDGTNDSETAMEDPNNDVNGVDVEDGTKN